MSDRLLTITELAEKWGRPRAFVYHALHSGLPFIRPNRTHYVREADADTWLAQHTRTQGALPAMPVVRTESLREQAERFGLDESELIFNR